MTVRDVIGGTLFVAILVLLGAVGWQTAANKTEIGGVAKNITQLSDKIDEAAKDWAAAKVNLAQSVSQESANLVRLEDALKNTNRALDKVKSDLETNIAATKDQQQNLLVVLQGTQKDVDHLRGIVEPPRVPPAPGASPAAQPPVKQLWGTLRIDNRTSDWQDLEVNGEIRQVKPRSILPVPVAVMASGSVTTRLVHFDEGVKTWTLNAPDYSQTVIIEPVYRSQP
jgi:hypothetical protein